jgi:DNA-binding ferritin-like protein
MFEEVREKMCHVKEMVDELFRPGHQISEEMRELIDLFDKATVIPVRKES